MPYNVTYTGNNLTVYLSYFTYVIVQLFVHRSTGITSQARSQHFTLGGGAQTLRGCTFFSKTLTTFFVVALKTWAFPAAGSIYLRYLRPTEHNTCDWENSVTLLNKAGPTSQQSQFFSLKKLHSIDDGGNGLLLPSLRPCNFLCLSCILSTWWRRCNVTATELVSIWTSDGFQTITPAFENRTYNCSEHHRLLVHSPSRPLQVL